MLGNQEAASVFFPHDFAAGSHYLIELDESEARALNDDGQGYVSLDDLPYQMGLTTRFFTYRLTIRGRPNDDAVVVTSNDTFSVKAVQTSNSLFILAPTTSPVCQDVSRMVHDEEFGYAVIETTSGYMELTRVVPSVQRLRLLLEAFPYAGPEVEATRLGDPVRCRCEMG